MKPARYLLKRSIKNLVLLIMLPAFVLYWILSGGGKSDSVFQSFSQFLSLLPGKAGVYLRAAFYRLACPDTSDEISIGFLTILSHKNTTIHKGVYIGPQCNIGMCTIGKDTLIGSGVHILSGNEQHRFSDPEVPIQEQGGSFERIVVGTDCWIGNSCVVLSSISNHCIVAAAAVVVSEFEEGSILAGLPAKKISSRPS